jgi:hypothetical protein
MIFLKEKGTRQPLYGMRVGKHRVEFFIEEYTIFISRMFQRSGVACHVFCKISGPVSRLIYS